MANNKDYAIVVGISVYPQFQNLQGPENDARAFYDWLRSPGGGDIQDESRLALILSSQFDNPPDDPFEVKPALQQVDKEFEKLVEQGDEGVPLGRRLYIYLAGHGFGPDVEEAALLMANASRRRMHHIPGRRYARWFRTAAFFEEVVLLMDCCRDDYPEVPLHVPAWPEVRDPGGADVRYFYGFATKWYRKARERPIPPPDGPVRGVFTLALLEALDKALPDGEGRLTGAAIEDYVFNRLPELMDENEYQEPRFEYDKRRDIVFKQQAATDLESATGALTIPVRVIWPPALTGQSLEILGPDLTRLAQTVTGSEPWQLRLPVGLYIVQGAGGAPRKFFEVLGKETVDVHLDP